MKSKAKPNMILRQIAKRHAKDLFITEVKDGPTQWGGHRRIDAIAVKRSWAHPCLTGYEVKVDKQDFLRDEKWPGYRHMCHRLFFACPAGLIEPRELPEDVGLIWMDAQKQTIWTKRKATFRDIEIPWQMLYYLVIARTDSDRHPFFSSRREYLEAWVEDKEERKHLGDVVKGKLMLEIKEQQKEISRFKSQMPDAEQNKREIRRAKEIMSRAGCIGGYRWLDELEATLKTRIPQGIAQSCSSIEREIKRIKDVVGWE